jgi:protein-tyrosine phosphatase
MLKILYVCLGNICRSPIAEGTMRHLIEGKGLSAKIEVDSAGTMDYHIGAQPDHRTRTNAEAHGIFLTHKCRQFSIQDFSDFEYIVAMDQSNLEDINILSLTAFGTTQPAERCFLLRNFELEAEEKNVPDPYYGTKTDFEAVYQIVKKCNVVFLDWIVKKHNL